MIGAAVLAPATAGLAPRRFTAGIVAVLGLTLFSLGAWFQWNPFDDPYKLKAVVSDTSNLGTRSPVRIAGIEVGKVTGVKALEGGGGEVEMELHEEALPIHRDAELKVRPRIFLGGNFFVELEPGTPGAPVMPDGGMIARDRASVSVQVPDVLAALSADTRRDLQTVVREGAAAVDDGGGEGLREAIPFLEPSLRDLAVTAEAALGEDPDEDLRRGLRGTS